ncbi:ComEC/Rec2 family competence protein [uncultured Psychroserpens sp.]|uniref:ComEC/Rec2 family competence protein n=1 Tax=uncultured Psychroserpens sp. TaxID=255436 RepID=UPI0026110C5A|nr:ComEC/Rec2 family competence protein [uncultured Psychroserpens sp.]
MKPLNFIIIKLTACLVIGILAAHFLPLSLSQSFSSTIFLFLGFIFLFHHSKRQFRKHIWFGLSSFLLMCCIGALIYNLHDQKNFKYHYTSIIDDNNTSSYELTIQIRERLKPTLYHNKYVVKILDIDEQVAVGKLLLNIEKDSLDHTYNVDDILFTSVDIQPIHKSLNPYQFNYKAYLEKQYIYHQLYSNSKSIITLKSQKQTLFGYAESLRKTINYELETSDFKSEQLNIINALILGQRQDMDQDIYADYINAGAVHILAVSGLHVGIILMLLSYILKPFERFKNGKLIKISLIILLLWMFAIIAGLSASVTRAVTMFSIVAFALNLKRPTNIYNTLTISILILLLCKPMFLFDVGFQMSYLAVFAIVSLQPILYKFWKPKWKITDYLWQIFTVTIAAQIGVIPISLYYFHQFPGLFFISNLAIIPCLGLILCLGILVIILALLHSLPEFLAHLFGYLIHLMNAVVNWIAEQDTFIMTSISFDIEHVLVSYFTIIAIVFLYQKKSFKHLSFFLISLILIQGVWIYSEYKNANSKFVIFHKNRFSLIAKKVDSELNVFDNLDSIAYTKDKTIMSFCIGNFINTIKRRPLQSVYQFQNKTLLVIDSLSIYNVKHFKPDFVLLRNSPRIHLDRLIDSIHPKLIIADGSNYKSYIKRWESTCKKRKLPFHQTGKKGAFIIK